MSKKAEKINVKLLLSAILLLPLLLFVKTRSPEKFNYDGIYLDKDFGFSFNYPTGFFDKEYEYVNYLGQDGGYARKEWSDNDKKIFLSLDIVEMQYANARYPEYFEALKLSNGESSKQSNFYQVERLQTINLAFDPYSIMYFTSKDNDQENLWHSYSFAWEKDNKLFILALGSDDKSAVLSNFDLFKEIVKTIKKI